MIMKRLMLILVFVIFSSSAVFASEPVLENGFKAFKELGVETAFRAWAKGGPFDGSKELMAQASQFGQIGAYYGKYSSHEYIFSKQLSERNKIVYVILNLEKGPLFGQFYLSKDSEGKWIVPKFRFHTDIEQIWPSELYAK
jgi:hypothetical protein